MQDGRVVRALHDRLAHIGAVILSCFLCNDDAVCLALPNVVCTRYGHIHLVELSGCLLTNSSRESKNVHAVQDGEHGQLANLKLQWDYPRNACVLIADALEALLSPGTVLVTSLKVL